jgi:acetoacetyl-CoA synthetase
VFRGRSPDSLALQFRAEGGLPSLWSWGQLRDQTARITAGLRRLGIGRGDRVAAYLPNAPETVAACLACASIGAIWSSAAPEFGARAVVDRFSQIEPKVLLAVNGYRYGGREFDRCGHIEEMRRGLPSVEATVVLERLRGLLVPGAVTWDDLVADPGELSFTRVPFDHPLWVLYSSGTTGLPKPIVHGHGGMLLEHLKVILLHTDAQASDRVFWFTTTGWMMWNFVVGVLLSPASIVLYDGSPSGDALWDLAEETGTTIFGTSAAFISAGMKAGTRPRVSGRRLERLRAVGSTGSSLSPEGFSWVYDNLGPDLWLFSTSGGTDMCTSFVGGVPTLPVYRGELQARALGAKVEAWDPDGGPLAGEVGELVITEPMPCMPVGFWGDADGSRLFDTYFSYYPGVWRHGDWIEITEHGGAIISGRSDSTINRAGVRIGTSEIYRTVLTEDAVVDALVVDLVLEDGQDWMPLFVVLRDGTVLTDELTNSMRARVRRDCSPRHVPSEIIAVDLVPRTLSGKLLEIPVKRILSGRQVADALSLDSLANPDGVRLFVEQALRHRDRRIESVA